MNGSGPLNASGMLQAMIHLRHSVKLSHHWGLPLGFRNVPLFRRGTYLS
jgi:hypothetical protein